MFFAGRNKVRLWNVMRVEKTIIPWDKAIHALLNGGVNFYREKAFRLSMVLVLLQNRPDIVAGMATSKSI